MGLKAGHEVIEPKSSGFLHQAGRPDQPGTARLQLAGIADADEKMLVLDYRRIGREPEEIGVEPAIETRAQGLVERCRALALALETEGLEELTTGDRVAAAPIDGQHDPAAAASDQHRAGAHTEDGAQEAAADALRSSAVVLSSVTSRSRGAPVRGPEIHQKKGGPRWATFGVQGLR
jgi:hypothetical protein